MSVHHCANDVLKTQISELGMMSVFWLRIGNKLKCDVTQYSWFYPNPMNGTVFDMYHDTLEFKLDNYLNSSILDDTQP